MPQLHAGLRGNRFHRSVQIARQVGSEKNPLPRTCPCLQCVVHLRGRALVLLQQSTTPPSPPAHPTPLSSSLPSPSPLSLLSVRSSLPFSSPHLFSSPSQRSRLLFFPSRLYSSPSPRSSQTFLFRSMVRSWSCRGFLPNGTAPSMECKGATIVESESRSK